jgi:hypothetical protein
MSLEKREIFPNRFRYVCATCSFNWPRTPLPESELPPPPRHSCRGASEPLSAAAGWQASPAQAANSRQCEANSLKPLPLGEDFPHSAESHPQAIPAAVAEVLRTGRTADKPESSTPGPRARKSPVTQSHAPQASTTQTSATGTPIPCKYQAAATKNPLGSSFTPASPRKDKKGACTGAIKPRPVAVCTRCEAVSYDVPQINGRCANQIAGKRCVGVNGSALHQDDWKLCPKCSGSGTADRSPCGTCNSAGWLYTRHPKRR